MVKRWWGWVVAVAPAAALACELAEVTIPSHEPVVVVQAVLDAARDTQFVIVEESFSGELNPRFFGGVVVPPEPASLPISGATVMLTHLDPGACPGAAVLLSEASFVLRTEPPETLLTGTYMTSALCPLAPGDRVALRVETPDGRVVTGATRMPGLRVATIEVSEQAAGSPLTLDRERDTLSIAVDADHARGLQVELVDRGFEALRIVTDTMELALAGDLVDPFDDGDRVFLAGRVYDVVVSVTDTSYYDFARSRADPLTGRGFINRLDGGIGVFGSVATARGSVAVVGPQQDAREGVYRITGTVDGAAVDVTWNVFLAPAQFGGSFSAVMEGTWLDDPIRAGIDGAFDGGAFLASLARRLAGGAGPAEVTTFEGAPPGLGSPFGVTVRVTGGPHDGATGTLTAEQGIGPSAQP